MEATILMAVSKWAVKNFDVAESLTKVSAEILQKCLWNPLKQSVMKFFSSEKETQDFIEQISNRKSINEQKPARDIEDVYEEMKGHAPDKELFEKIARFFADNQELIKNANRENHENDYNKISISGISQAENVVTANNIGTLTIYPKDRKE